VLFPFGRWMPLLTGSLALAGLALVLLASGGAAGEWLRCCLASC